MLLELRVSNFAVIDQLTVQFGAGFNVLSGETGAGKSVLLKSLALLMGVKGSYEILRNPKSLAQVEGVFDLSDRADLLEKLKEWGLACEDQLLIVRRTISEDKSRVYINGASCTLTQLRDIISPLVEVTGHYAPLIEMTGQHENRNLLSSAYHLEILDLNGGQWMDRVDYKKKYKTWQTVKAEIAELQTSRLHREQRVDYLTHQKIEIERLNPTDGEDVLLQEQIGNLKASQKLLQFAEQIENTLQGEDLDLLNQLQKVGQLSREVPQLQGLTQLSQAQVLLEDYLFEVRKMCKGAASIAQELDLKQERYSDLRKLTKRYGPSLANVLSSYEGIVAELRDLADLDSKLSEKGRLAAKLGEELAAAAGALHKKRQSAANKLSSSVSAELADLNMKGVNFHVSVLPKGIPTAELEIMESLGPTGISTVEFQISSNSELHSLSKVASGGELSRILLALKSVVGSGPFPRSFLFDEVDAGVSGPTAEKVGRKLKKLAIGQQVICVTHLPQVAACADSHFLIQKQDLANSVFTTVELLEGAGRIQELARLISGETITKTSLAHAKQLLHMAAEIDHKKLEQSL